MLWSLQVWEYKAGRGCFVGLEGLLRIMEILPCREGLLWASFCIRRDTVQPTNLKEGRVR